MTLEKEYKENLKLFAQTYGACVLALQGNGDDPDDIIAFLEALRITGDRFRKLRDAAIGEASLPKLEIFFDHSCHFNEFTIVILKQLMASDSIPASEQFRLEELLYAGIVIKNHLKATTP